VIIKQSQYSGHVTNTMLDALGSITNVIRMYGFSGTFKRVALWAVGGGVLLSVRRELN
jgi:hypothetical protein